MRKLTKPLGKVFFSFLGMLSLLLLSHTANAAFFDIGEPLTVSYSATGTKYGTTPMESGILTVTLSSAVNYGEGGDTFILYKGQSNTTGTPVVCLTNNGTDRGDGVLQVSEATFEVEGFTDYYLQFPAWEGTVNTSLAAGSVGGGGDEPGDDTKLELPIDGTIKLLWDNTSNKWYYTPAKNGLLTCEVTNGLIYGGDYLFTESGSPVSVASSKTDTWGPPGNYTSVSWEVTAGTTYYFQNGDQNNDGKVCSFTFSEGSGGGGDTTDPDPTPGLEWDQMEMTTYTTSGIASIMLQYTPSTNGTLTASQNPNTAENHLYVSEPVYDETYGWDSTANIMKLYQGAETPSGQSLFKYNLEAGKTYYYLAKTSTYDNLSSVTFSWQAQEVASNVIPDGVETTVNVDEVYTYTAASDGILTVTTNSYSSSIVYLNANNCVYTNASHTRKLNAISTGDAPGAKGWEMTFEVKAGTTYYVFVDSDPMTIQSGKVNMLFSLKQGQVEPAVSLVEPAPGVTLDLNAQETTFTVGFEPAQVTLTGVSLVYTDSSGKEQTLQLKNSAYEYAGDAWRIALPQFITIDGERNNTNTSNSMLGNVSGYEIKYVLAGVNFNGTPVSTSNVVGAVAENGTVSITYAIGEPVSLVGTKFPTPFLQYWAPGSEDAKAVLTFTGDIKGVGMDGRIEATIVEGHIVPPATPGEEAATVAITYDNMDIDANTLTINFAGLDMTSIPVGSEASIILTSIAGTNGLLGNFGFNTPGMYIEYVTVSEAEIPDDVVTVKNLVPAMNSEIALTDSGTADFEIEFSAPVKIEQAFGPVASGNFEFETSAVSPDANGFATTWNVTFSAAYIALQQEEGVNAYCNIVAKDEKGNLVLNSQSENYLVVSYALPEGTKGVDFDVVVPTEVTGELDKFLVGIPQDSEYQYIEANDYSDGYFNAYQNIKITGEDFEASPVADAFADGFVTFSPAITKSGTYKISFPYNAFTLGTEGGELEGQGGFEAGFQKASMEKEYTFSVTVAQPTDATCSTTPEVGSTLDIATDGTVAFVMNFSVPATLKEYKYGQTGLGNLIVTPTPGADVYETQYTFTFPRSYVDDQIWGWDPSTGLERGVVATIFAEDVEGNKFSRVGEDGIVRDDLSMVFYLNCDEPAGAPFEVTMLTEATGELSTFTVAPLDGFDYVDAEDKDAWDDETQEYTNYFRNITVTGADGFKATATAYDEETGEVTFTPAITVSGQYTLNIPYHAFTIGINGKEPEGQGGAEAGKTYWSQAVTKTLDITITEKEEFKVILGFTGFDGDEEGLKVMKVFNEQGDDVTPTNGMIMVTEPTTYRVEMPKGWTVTVECEDENAPEDAFGYLTENGDDIDVTTITIEKEANGLELLVVIATDGGYVPEPVYSATLALVGDDTALGKAKLYNYATEEDITPSNGVAFISFQGESAKYAVVLPKGYEVTVYTEDENAPEDAFDSLTEAGDDEDTTIITLYPEANGLEILIEVQPEGDVNPDPVYTANLLLVGDDTALGKAKLYNYATEEDITPSNGIAKVSFQGESAKYSVVLPKGYEVSVYTEDENAPEDAFESYTEAGDDEDTTIITLYPEANGLDILIEVQEEGSINPDPINVVRFGLVGDDTALGHLKLIDYATDEDITPSNGLAVVSFTGESHKYAVEMPKGYEVSVYTEDENAPEDAFEYITEAGDDVDTTLITVYAEANGLMILIEVQPEGSIEPEPVYENTFNFTLAEGALETLSIVASTTEEVLTLTDNALNISYEGESYEFVISISDKYNVAISSTDVVAGAETYTVSSNTEDGVNTYTVTLYPGSDAAVFTVDVTKASGIANLYDLDGAEGYNVVTVNGVVVLRNGTTSDLNLLEPGMYIVNGKKVVVRK